MFLKEVGESLNGSRESRRHEDRLVMQNHQFVFGDGQLGVCAALIV